MVKVKSKKLSFFPCNFVNVYFTNRVSKTLCKSSTSTGVYLQANVYRIAKADPRYRVTLSVCDRFENINLSKFKDQNNLLYTTSQTKSLFSKELLLVNQTKKRQFFTVLKEFIIGLNYDISGLALYQNLSNKQGSQIISSNFFKRETNYLNFYYNFYLNTIASKNLIGFAKPSLSLLNAQIITNRLTSVIPLYLNGSLFLNIGKSTHYSTLGGGAALNPLTLMKDDLQTLYLNIHTSLNTWVSSNNKQPIHALPGFGLQVFTNDIINSLKYSRRVIASQYKNTLRKNRFKDLIKGRNYFDAAILSHYRNTSVDKFNLKSQTGNRFLNKVIWKTNNYIKFKERNRRIIKSVKIKYPFLKKNHLYSFFTLRHRFNKNKKTKKRLVVFAKKQPILKGNTNQNLLYLLFRLEEKIDLLPENVMTKKLIRVYNLIKILLNEKQQRVALQNGFLFNKNRVMTLRKAGWKRSLKKTILHLASKSQDKVIKLFVLAKKLLLKFNKTKSKRKLKKNKFNLKLKLQTTGALKNIRRVKPRLLIKTKNVRRTFKFKSKVVKVIKAKVIKFKVVKAKVIKKRFKRKQIFSDKIRLTENYTQLKENRNALGLLINKKINFFFINALALTKYAYNVQRKWDKKPTRSPNKYLQNLDRDLINRYKYVAIYIKDFIRVCFIGMFLKKPTFITRFIAFLISELPRNRKETTFLKCVMKIVRIFSAERGEIVGLRIKFKGRVNRWRRTKALTANRGHIAFNTLTKRIIYGSAHAINRKGAIGIGLWIYYKPEFTYQPRPSITFTHLELSKESILNYIKYSQKKTHYLKNYKKLLLTSK